VEKPPEEPPEEAARKSRIFWGRAFGVAAIVLGVICIVAGRSSDPSRDPYRGAMGLDLLLDFFFPRSQVYASYEHSGVRTSIEGLGFFLAGVALLIFPEACNPF
jgi:drug/metabolite transporter (DMT)-like permease